MKPRTEARTVRRRAYKAIHAAIRKGRLVRTPCVICHDPITEAHHPFGYAEEYRTKVVFLCRKHHAIADILGRIDRERKIIGPA